MHGSDAILRNLAIVLTVAAVTTVIFQRLRQPGVVGYIVAGLLVGPGVFSLVTDLGIIQTLAELGVVLLMASIGLEFSFRTLSRLGPRVAVVAVVEIGLMILLGSTVGRVAGWSPAESLFLGGMIAISSTMIIARVFADASPPPSRTLRELVLGVLIMEDLAAIVLIVILTTVAAGTTLTGAAIGGTLGRLLLVLTALTVAGLLVVPRAIRYTVRLRRPETTLVAVIGVIFLFALLARLAGYSVALGAFLAGAVLHESGAVRQIEVLLQPVRDMFAAIFFVAVGMLIDPAVLGEIGPLVLMLVGVVLVGKTVGVTTGAMLAGYSLRTAMHAGLTMTQIGEFSFIIAGLTLTSSSDTMGNFFPVAVAVSVVTSLATPWLQRRGDAAACAVDRRLPKPLQMVMTLHGSWIESLRRATARDAWRRGRRHVAFLLLDTVVITGLLVGTSLALGVVSSTLAERLDISPVLARAVVLVIGGLLAVPFGIGLVTSVRRLARLLSEGVMPAVPAGKVDQAAAPRRTLSLAIEIGVVVLVGIPVVIVSQPFVPYGGAAVVGALLLLMGIAFWRNASDLRGHALAGAELVVHVLGRQGTPGHEDDLSRVEALLPGLGFLEPVRLVAGTPADGKSIGELNLRGLTGATVVALVRGEDRTAFPPAGTRLTAGDLVALTGSHDAVAAARRLLNPLG